MLDAVELMPIDAKTDRPLEDLTILDTVVMKNPFREALAELLLKDWKANKLRGDQKDATKWTSMSSLKGPGSGTGNVGDGIGKYMSKHPQ